MILGIVGFILGSHRDSNEIADSELRAINAGEKARLDAIDRGADAANAEVDRAYRRQLGQLDIRQKRKSDRFRRNPARRVRFLERLSSKRSRR